MSLCAFGGRFQQTFFSIIGLNVHESADNRTAAVGQITRANCFLKNRAAQRENICTGLIDLVCVVLQKCRNFTVYKLMAEAVVSEGNFSGFFYETVVFRFNLRRHIFAFILELYEKCRLESVARFFDVPVFSEPVQYSGFDLVRQTFYYIHKSASVGVIYMRQLTFINTAVIIYVLIEIYVLALLVGRFGNASVEAYKIRLVSVVFLKPDYIPFAAVRSQSMSPFAEIFSVVVLGVFRILLPYSYHPLKFFSRGAVLT